MTHAEAGRKGGKASGDTRLKRSRKWLLEECRTYRDVLRWVQQAERRAYERGWIAGKRRALREIGEMQS